MFHCKKLLIIIKVQANANKFGMHAIPSLGYWICDKKYYFAEDVKCINIIFVTIIYLFQLYWYMRYNEFTLSIFRTVHFSKAMEDEVVIIQNPQINATKHYYFFVVFFINRNTVAKIIYSQNLVLFRCTGVLQLISKRYYYCMIPLYMWCYLRTLKEHEHKYLKKNMLMKRREIMYNIFSVCKMLKLKF